ncbi:acetyl-CoA synthetase-like protein [Panus rudis PR-1116 ss-1]|nr:acetyl-CoA synthetase-like protein [Panus rudis PR-1116 ss-1]
MAFPELPQAFPKNLDYRHQSLEVPGTKKPGQTSHYRNAAFPFVSLDLPNTFRTLVEVFESGLRRNANAKCLGQRQLLSNNPVKWADHFEWQSYSTVDARRRAIGSGLYKLFNDGVLSGGDLRTVGIWSKNCASWQLIDLAVQGYGLVTVSLYDTLGKDAVEYSINHAETTVVFAAAQHIPSLLKLAPKIAVVKIIVSMDPLSADSKSILTAWGQEQGIKIMDFSELEEFGKQHLTDLVPVTADTVATICYTSGTTGNPKGAVLTHGNLANSVHGNLCGIELEGEIPNFLAYLPLAHIFERQQELNIFALGGSIGYGTQDPLRLLEDMQLLRPNIIPAVPRVLNRIYQAITAAANAPGLKGALFNRALQTKLERLKTTGINKHAFWDRLVFRKIQAVLGGNLKFIGCGSAPISGSTMEFLRVALACEIIEGYGMTENCGTATRVWPNDPNSGGTVGGPHANSEIKLIDVPAMGYSSEDKPHPRGEICVRGDHCFRQYYKDEANTKSTVDGEGWIHTGDVGEIDDCGRLKIIDRVKNIMKLSQGEYVAIERVESLYAASPIVAQLYVHGDSLQSYLIAVVVPEPTQLALLASRVLGTKVNPEDGAALVKAVKDPKVQQAVLQELNKEAERVSLRGFERIKRIHITLEPFTVENGCLTPTLKIRRKDAYNKYKTELDGLYALGEPKL